MLSCSRVLSFHLEKETQALVTMVDSVPAAVS